MKLIMKLAGMGLMTLALAGCFDGSDSNSDQAGQPQMSEDFGTFVKGEFDNPNPNRESTKINDIEFSFNDQNDPKAFDDLLK